MSFPIYEDLDKTTADLLNDDFDSKYSLKIKSAGPYGVVFTTNTTLDSKTKLLDTKLSTKYAHASGFTLEKLELAKGSFTTETSLVNAAPGLKLEFKGNDKDKGDLSFTYAIPKVATLTGKLDALHYNKASASVSTGHGPFTGGASIDLSVEKSVVTADNYTFGFGYSVPKTLFAGLKAGKSLSEFSGLVQYAVSNKLTLLGKLNYATSGKVVGASGVLGGIYQCAPSTTLKLKTSSAGVINASVKQQFEKKFAVVGSTEVTTGSSISYKFGVNATLG